MAVRTPSGKALPGNLAIIPSEQSWFFMPFIGMHFHICILPKLVLEIALCLLTKTKQSTDQLRLSSETSDFKQSTVMLCTFHGVWMAFKKDLLTLQSSFLLFY